MEELEGFVISLSNEYNTKLHGGNLQKELKEMRNLHPHTIGRKCRWNFARKDFATYCIDLGINVSEYISDPLDVKTILEHKEQIICFLNSMNNRGFLELLNRCHCVNLTEIDTRSEDDMVSISYTIFLC